MNLKEQTNRIKQMMGLSEQVDHLLMWLKSNELEKHHQLLLDKGIDDIEKLKKLSQEDLKNMGVSLGDRKRFEIGMKDTGPKEQSFLDALSKRINDKRRQENPYNDKEYNPNNDGDFSNSEVKDVVWRAGVMKLDSKSGGLWFAETKDGVEKFALSVRGEKREGKPYHINLQNPMYYDSFWRGYLRDAESHGREGLMDMLAADGNDGIIIGRDTWNDTGDENSVTSKQYIVFNPENIKPA